MLNETIHYAQANSHEILVALGQHIEVALIATVDHDHHCDPNGCRIDESPPGR
jgi:hypothetical protein